MNLAPLFPIQKELDARIEKEHGLEGKDLLPEKILALQVELGELANEWRGFKFWKRNPKPRTKIEHLCPICAGTGDENAQANLESKMEGGGGYPFLKCEECDGSGKLGESNPLLEEYVDCLHFILSIGIQKGFEIASINTLLKHDNVLDQFNECFTRIYVFQDQLNKYRYVSHLQVFLGLGEMLGFTWEEIEEAYYSKNQTNHIRQSEGY
jgi:dimeric dUTPase (all-alpha-NTP-PPase superfamily)